MKKNSFIVALLALFIVSAIALPAFAQSRSRCASGLCTKGQKRASGTSNRKQYSQRGITAGKNTLNILFSPVARTGDLDLGLGLLQPGGVNFLNASDQDLATRVGFGAAYGINDNLEVGTYLLNIQSAEESEVTSPIFWATARGISEVSEYAFRVGVTIPARDEDDFVLHLATPIFILAGSSSFELALAVNGIFSDPETQWVFAIPVKFQTNITKEVFAGVKTSFILPEFQGDALIIPLGFFAGYTVMIDNKPLADIGVGFNFPFFVFPDVEDGEATKQIITELFEIGVGANFMFKF